MNPNEAATIIRSLKATAEKFRDRLGQNEVISKLGYDVVEDVQDYADRWEWELGFEILCAQLCDHDIPISRAEFEELTAFEMTIPLTRRLTTQMDCLEHLVDDP